MELIYRVYCEFKIDGELHKSMESPASWFLMTQMGKLWTYDPGETPHPLAKEYKKAIPLFYTGLKDKNGKEIYEGDILVLKFQNGDICCNDFVLRNFIEDSYALLGDKYIKEIIGNIYENPELLKDGE